MEKGNSWGERAHHSLNRTWLAALVGAVVMTWIAPRIINLLFTPPISFGTNCEPAAAWSMGRLIYSQIAGLVIGPIVYFVFRLFKKSNTTPDKAPTAQT